MAHKEVPVPRFNTLVTGHFHTAGEYSTWRTLGSGDYLLILTASGRGRFGYPGGEIVAEAGDAVLLAPRTPHDYGLESTLRQWELLWVHFHPRPHWQSWLLWPAAAEGGAGPGLMRLRPDSETFSQVSRRLADAHALATGALPLRDQFAMNALEEVLLRLSAVNPLGGTRLLDARVQSAMEYFCQNLAGDTRLDHAAEAVGLSASRLAHLFRQQTGATPQRFLERQRLSRASQLLQTTQLSVKEIARQVGFADPFYFTARFKRQLGMGPRAYRQKLGRGNGEPRKTKKNAGNAD